MKHIKQNTGTFICKWKQNLEYYLEYYRTPVHTKKCAVQTVQRVWTLLWFGRRWFTTHTLQGFFTGTGAIMTLVQCLQSNTEGYGKCITQIHKNWCYTHNKPKPNQIISIFHGIYCFFSWDILFLFNRYTVSFHGIYCFFFMWYTVPFHCIYSFFQWNILLLFIINIYCFFS